MPPQQEGDVAAQLELSVGDYQINGASIGFGPKGSHFACTLGPVSDETLAALDSLVLTHGKVCLLFSKPLLLDLVSLERKEPQRIRIVGRITEEVSGGSRPKMNQAGD